MHHALSVKLRLAESVYSTPAIEHWCPACREHHGFAVSQPLRNGARWTWDGNVDLPTFQPSMNIRIGPYPHSVNEPGRIDVCHYFLHAGRLQYLGDCTHAMAGMTVDLPDLPDLPGSVTVIAT